MPPISIHQKCLPWPPKGVAKYLTWQSAGARPNNAAGNIEIGSREFVFVLSGDGSVVRVWGEIDVGDCQWEGRD